jgi:hypothetical protein
MTTQTESLDKKIEHLPVETMWDNEGNPIEFIYYDFIRDINLRKALHDLKERLPQCALNPYDVEIKIHKEIDEIFGELAND